ncbi:ATP-dependent Clp protease proteolytic subunit [Bradyrhizobium sp. USDA 329]|uniref:ATP-dependent Clp protease proteolytic subunit n=1 Tax=unclassified Bradyrhizobium TaxID=2631580 RepID=UPI00351680C8
MRGQLRAILLGGWTALLPLEPAHAGQVEGRIDCHGVKVCTVEDLKVTGAIDKVDADNVLQLLRDAEARTDKSQVPDLTSYAVASVITLNSPGGSVPAAMAIGRLARQHRMVALVPGGASCVSACVLIYAGAVVRNARSTGGRIGIHAPFFLDAPDSKIDEQEIRRSYTSLVQDIRSYFREMNVSEALADEMLKTPASSVRFLSVEDQDRYGLVVMDPVESEFLSLSHAKQLGLTRLEHNRRSALVHQFCTDRTSFVSCADAVYQTGKPPELLDFSSQVATPTK